MASSSKAREQKHIPGSLTSAEEIFDFPYLADAKTMEYIKNHGRIMFILRGLPGTAKGTLSKVMSSRFPSATICCADQYFNQAFISKLRSKETLAESHAFCARSVERACKRNEHPIIVKNSHIMRKEVVPYLKFAEEYGYTVIMSITHRKVETDPQVLQNSNRKGLTKDYFIKRGQYWQEYIPIFLGWFLCPDDECFLSAQAKHSLANLLEDEHFCNTFKAHTKDEIWKKIYVRQNMFCISNYCNKGVERWRRNFYLKDAIQNVYGKCFDLSILGFVIRQDAILAVVSLSKELSRLMPKYTPKFEAVDDDDICSLIGNLTLQNHASNNLKSQTVIEDFTNKSKTATLQNCSEDDVINTDLLNFIIVADFGSKPKLRMDAGQQIQLIFDGMGNIVSPDNFSVLNNGIRYMKLHSNGWLILLDQKILVSSVFTGCYM